MCGRGWLALVLGLLFLPTASYAQFEDAVLPSPRAVLLAGTVNTNFDQPSTAGDGRTIGIRLDLPLGERAILEPSVERVSLNDDPENQIRWHVDFGVRGEIAVGSVRPFVGVAVGALLWPGDSRPATEDFVVATYGGLSGLRYDVTDRIGLRGEVRHRWLDGLESSITSFGLGLSWRF